MRDLGQSKVFIEVSSIQRCTYRDVPSLYMYTSLGSRPTVFSRVTLCIMHAIKDV